MDNLRKAKRVQGTFNILAYLPPTSKLYLKVPARPVGVFQYKVDMERISGSNEETNSNDKNEMTISEEIQQLEYPFVPDSDGPVELQKFFGY